MQYSARHVEPTNSFDSFQSGSYKGEVVVVVVVAPSRTSSFSFSFRLRLSLSLGSKATQRNELERRVGTAAGNDGVTAPRVQVATTTCSSDTVVLASQIGFKEAVLDYNVQCRSGFPLEWGGKMRGNPGYYKSRPDKAGRSSGHQSFYAAGFEDEGNKFNWFTGLEDGPSYLTGPWILGREPINQLGIC
ncbi:unnamed protein product [Sphagnum jensenii]|uniref:Uncharacterized protein n=1 Tax=Sphagnum jensenii TaxID=128206 RepID=A0ABP1A4F1_9BRYO